MCCELRVICLENEHSWWNLILWTTSLPSTWPKVHLIPKVTLLIFSQELIWRGEICYANIVVSRLILKMKWRYASWEMMYLIALSFSYTSYQSRPRGRRAFRLSLRTIDERFQKMVIFVCWLTPKYTLLLLTHVRRPKYADWLRSIFYCYLLIFGNLTRRR